MRHVLTTRCRQCAFSAPSRHIRPRHVPRHAHSSFAVKHVVDPQSTTTDEDVNAKPWRRKPVHAHSKQKAVDQPNASSPLEQYDLEVSAHLEELARSSYLSTETLLSHPSLPEKAIYAPKALHDALSHVASSDDALLIHFASRIQVSAPHIPIAKAVNIYCELIRQLGAHKMYAALAPSIGSYLVRMDQAIAKGEVYAPRMQRLYTPILQAMHSFAEEEHKRLRVIKPLPDVVRVEVYRVVRRMVDDLQRMPSSSTAQPAKLDHGVLNMLCNGRLMSIPLAKLLFELAGQNNQPLGPAQLHQCFVAAAREGDARLADMFLRQRATLSELSGAVLSLGEPESARTRKVRGITAEQHEAKRVREILLRAKSDGDLDETINRLLPYLHLRQADPERVPINESGSSSRVEQEQVQMLRYCWSILLVRAGQQPRVTTLHMLDLYATMPEEALCGHTLTPIIHALLELDDLDAAWRIWLEAVIKEEQYGQPGRFVDNVTLAVASEVCGRREGLDAAVRLVDEHAIRLSQLKRLAKSRTNLPGILVDTQNVNILMREAASARSPSTAFRLWTASRPRWGARMNGFSLGLLMNAARLCEYTSPDDPNGFVDDVDTRWRLLLSEMDPRRHFRPDEPPREDQKYRQYEEDGFSKGDAGVLLDPPGYKWYTAYGAYRPWQRARHMFREVALDNWPFLRAVKSPLTVQSGFLGFSSWGGSLPHPAPIEHATTLPLAGARYMHIIPTPGTWEAYIKLLGTFSRVQEIPLALAWMKELGITPDRTTTLIALTFVREAEGPRRLIKNWTAEGGSQLVRDEEVLRRWLQEWLGDGMERHKGEERSIVPTEDDVWRYRGWMSMKRMRLVL